LHELAITEGVVDAVQQRLPDATVTCVRLEIGPLSGVVPDSVRFCFDLVAEGTNLSGARLEISEPPARCRCHRCGTEFAPDGPFPMCRCGSVEVAVLSGDQLTITSVEVA
jgi:hydrogenase nickel incorporation protein HypA/HybF